MSVIVIGDSAADLPVSYIKQENIPIIPYPYNIGETPITGDIGDLMSSKEYYNRLRSGEVPGTSQLNFVLIEETVRQYLLKGDSVVFVCLSGKLSNTYNNVQLANENLKREFPNGEFYIVDSLSATWGIGILLRKAIQMRNDGCNAKEIYEWLMKYRHKGNMMGFVDDLDFLRMGGRLSNVQAFLGSMLSVKPLIYVDEEGNLCGGMKVRGHNKAMKTLRDLALSMKGNMIDRHLVIFHSDNLGYAHEVIDLIKDADSDFTFEITNLGPVIGAHTGPNTVAMTYFTIDDRVCPKL